MFFNVLEISVLSAQSIVIALDTYILDIQEDEHAINKNIDWANIESRGTVI